MNKPIEFTHYTSFAIDDLLFLGKQWKAERPQSARQIRSLVDLHAHARARVARLL